MTQRGSGTVLAIGLGIAAMVLICALSLLSQAVSGYQRAASAADLAALAAADAARGLSPGEPCQVADSVASRHGAVLNFCEVQGPMFDTVRVSASVQFSAPLSVFYQQVTVQARAGPPSQPA
ncbi:hypothetical protein UM93_11240 [Psychromicrobium lacuslunae]|uniref:Uncharacterized protein n=1 Tax=Psychromicrobium lacuslunae TaxID=1618207 RepID=A0A0D4C335_9MICC|nr:hypothetical protein UM93_11240 [Psychromicrobium lacuslunae]